FATVQDFVLEYAANISAGGVFVHTEQPPPLKTVVQVELELPGGGPPVPAKCMVVHRVTKEDAAQKGTLPGVGVQFMDAGDEFRQGIDGPSGSTLDRGRGARPRPRRPPPPPPRPRDSPPLRPPRHAESGRRVHHCSRYLPNRLGVAQRTD